MDEVKKVYEQYKHLDSMLSDAEWLGVKESPMKRCLYDLWMAIRHDCQTPSPPAYQGDGVCDRCGWPLKDDPKDGCTRDNCSMRPLPEKRTPTAIDNATDLRCPKYGKEAGKKGCDDCTGCTIPGCKLKGQLKELLSEKR